MRILIIGNGNLFSMPFLRHYTDVLDAENIAYDLLYWDRVGRDEAAADNYHRFVHIKAAGSGLSNLPGYLKYRKFVLPFFNRQKYDICIVFTVQMAILFRDKLRQIPYILDIRDYTYQHLPFYRTLEEKAIDGAAMNTISSEGYLQWLSKGRNYTMCHNVFDADTRQDAAPFDFSTRNISYIGTLRYHRPNIQFIDACRKIDGVNVDYYGNSNHNIDVQIADYCRKHDIKNVGMHGAFERSEIGGLYSRSNFSLAVYGTETMCERTLLPNRLYVSCALKRPIIVSAGTYLARVVKDNGLGFEFDPARPQELENRLNWYYRPDNYAAFCSNCEAYLAKVDKDMKKFPEALRTALGV